MCKIVHFMNFLNEPFHLWFENMYLHLDLGKKTRCVTCFYEKYLKLPKSECLNFHFNKYTCLVEVIIASMDGIKLSSNLFDKKINHKFPCIYKDDVQRFHFIVFKHNFVCNGLICH